MTCLFWTLVAALGAGIVGFFLGARSGEREIELTLQDSAVQDVADELGELNQILKSNVPESTQEESDPLRVAVNKLRRERL